MMKRIPKVNSPAVERQRSLRDQQQSKACGLGPQPYQQLVLPNEGNQDTYDNTGRIIYMHAHTHTQTGPGPIFALLLKGREAETKNISACTEIS